MSHYLSHGTGIRVDIVGEGAKEQERERVINPDAWFDPLVPITYRI